MGKVFIDTANLEQIEDILKRGILDGVTTNPTLISKEKREQGVSIMEAYIKHMHKITDLFKKYNTEPSLSVEVFTLDPKEMIPQAKELVSKIPYGNLAIKIPISYKGQDYYNVIKELSKEGITINATCGFTEAQLILAAKAGAKYVSLFYNRLISHFETPLEGTSEEQLEFERLPKEGLQNKEKARAKALTVLKNSRIAIDELGLKSEIILGSIRKPYDFTDGWKNGAHIVTGGYEKILGLSPHSWTDKSVADFDSDFKRWAKE